ANLINFGIIPFEFQNASDFKLLVQGTPITIENVVSTLKNENNKMIEGIADKNKISLKVDLTLRQREVLIAGGLLNYIRSIQHRS
ncbi:MAG: aconitate hydratase, partial [Thermoproteota archaeon]|nr:aconitate hydratase [Thermoproteota archaeon]